jgi:hypothetical protein
LINCIKAAIPLIERQRELVHARQQRLSDFADELSERLRSLQERQADLERKRARGQRG